MGLITIPHTFKNDTEGKATDLDACFGSIVTLVNGNLNENNVKKSADTLKIGGFSVAATPGVNKIIPLTSGAKFQWDGKPAISYQLYSGDWLLEYGTYIDIIMRTYMYPPAGANYMKLGIIIKGHRFSADNISIWTANGALLSTASYQPRIHIPLTTAKPDYNVSFESPWIPAEGYYWKGAGNSATDNGSSALAAWALYRS